MTDQPEPQYTGILGLSNMPPGMREHQEALNERYVEAERREDREAAVGLAVRALAPSSERYVTGHYGDAIIKLAKQLGDYIQHGVD